MYNLILHEPEASIGKALKGAAIANYCSLRLALRVKIDEK
jgi:hypothetical protein